MVTQDGVVTWCKQDTVLKFNWCEAIIFALNHILRAFTGVLCTFTALALGYCVAPGPVQCINAICH